VASARGLPAQPPDAHRPGSRCRECARAATRDWRERNRERLNAERRTAYREAHPRPLRKCVECRRSFTGRPDALVCSPECRRCGSSSSGAACIGALPSACQHRPSPLPSASPYGEPNPSWVPISATCDRCRLPRLTVPNCIETPHQPRAISAELRARTPSDSGWSGTAGGMANSCSPSCALGVRAKSTS
jgi:hypothetical protein